MSDEQAAANPGRLWYLYVLHCRGGSLYTGITTDVAKRYAAHAAGKGARYTRSFPPLSIALVLQFDGKGDALAAEHAVKAMSAAQKRAWLAAQMQEADSSAGNGR
ncbi:putative endonuclease [Vogesella perlucida]|nr:putative endonuclease [Vogesella perlucida]